MERNRFFYDTRDCAGSKTIVVPQIVREYRLRYDKLISKEFDLLMVDKKGPHIRNKINRIKKLARLLDRKIKQIELAFLSELEAEGVFEKRQETALLQLNQQVYLEEFSVFRAAG